jgi:hypothetical protein
VPVNKEIRVLLLHHSSQYTAHRVALQITRQSKAALYDFGARHNIRILLCGHTHAHKLPDFKVLYLGGTYALYEACCGATTLLTDLPPEAKNVVGQRPARRDWRPNSLLVHRLLSDEVKLVWQTQVYIEKASIYEHDPAFDHFIEWRFQ